MISSPPDTTLTVRPPFAHEADHDHPYARDYRIPLVPSAYPWWTYEVAVVYTPEERRDSVMCGVLPTEDEARIIAAYIDYRRSWYREGYAAKMLERPFDVDSGTNTVVLIKRESEGWGYRRASYTSGPPIYPAPRSVRHPDVPQYDGPDGLLALLDKINENSARWTKFKTTRTVLGGED